MKRAGLFALADSQIYHCAHWVQREISIPVELNKISEIQSLCLNV